MLSAALGLPPPTEKRTTTGIGLPLNAEAVEILRPSALPINSPVAQIPLAPERRKPSNLPPVASNWVTIALGSGLACTRTGLKLSNPKKTATEYARKFVIFIKITLKCDRKLKSYYGLEKNSGPSKLLHCSKSLSAFLLSPNTGKPRLLLKGQTCWSIVVLNLPKMGLGHPLLPAG